MNIKKPSILFVIKGSALNRNMNTGIENLAWGLAEEGLDVHILSGGKKPYSHNYIVPKNVKYYFNNLSGTPESFIEEYANLRKDNKFNIVVGWVKNIAPLAYYEKKINIKSDVKFIVNQGTITSEEGLSLSKVKKHIRKILNLYLRNCLSFTEACSAFFFPKRLYSKIDFVISITEAVKLNVIDIYGIEEKKCKVIPRGIDTEFFTSGEKKKCEAPYFRVLFTGNIIESKGVGDIVRAVNSLNFPVDVVLCGNADQGYLDELEAILQSDDKSIVYLGALSRNELLKEYRCADLFLFCTFGSDGLGKSLLEAMSCKLPVIVSDIPIFKEVVKHKYNGLVVPASNPDSLAEAILMFYESFDLMQTCSVNARETILSNFSKQKELQEWRQVINEYSIFN